MPNILTYVPTYIVISNLTDSYVAIYNDSSVLQYYVNSNQTIELPYSANNTWTYKIARYGYKLITGNFVIDRNTGGTVTISPNYTPDAYVVTTTKELASAVPYFTQTQQIYDYLSYYRTTSSGITYGDLNQYVSYLDVGSKNIILLDSASPVFTYDGTTFTLKTSTLSGSEIRTTGIVDISGNSVITDITITPTIINQIPSNLTDVIINGILSYNVNTPASIVYTNCTVQTVVNNGTGTVLIERINSTINNATDPEIQNYAPTIINITPNGGSVAIYDNTDIRQYFITSNYTISLPAQATGTWSYKVAKYAYNLITNSFTINSETGATIDISPNYVPDVFTTSSVSAVSAYTDLDSTQKMYNYLSYYKTLSTGIDYGDLASKAFGSITFNNNLTLNKTASSILQFDGSLLTLKSSSLDEDIFMVVADDFLQANGNTISDGVKIRANNLDSEIIVNGVNSLTFYPTESARDNNTTPGDTVTNGIFRFKYGSTYSGVVFETRIYARVDVNTILLYTSPIETGYNLLDLGIAGRLAVLERGQNIINDGVQKASILVPHTTDI